MSELDHIRNLLQKSDLTQALKLTLKYVKKGSKSLENEAILHSSRFNDLVKKERKNLVSQEFLSIERGNLTNSLLQFLTVLEDEYANKVKPRKTASNKSTTELNSIYEKLKHKFNDDEFQELCFLLGVRYDHLLGSTYTSKARELILLYERDGKIGELISIIETLRESKKSK